MSESITKEQASIQAKRLREYLCKRYGEITHAACMQAVAFMHGFKSWYHLLEQARDSVSDESGEITTTKEN